MTTLPDGFYGHPVFEHGSDAEYMAEVMAENARNHGEMDPQREWILTPFDTWVRNPHYTGPAGPHPEDEFLEGDDSTPDERWLPGFAGDEMEDIPF